MPKLIFLLIVYLTTCAASLAQPTKLRLMTYNIRNGKGMDNKVDYDRTATVIKNVNAEVMALQELDSVTKRNNGDDVLKILSEKTGFFYVYGAAISFQGGKYGVGILSRQKPLRYYKVPLPGKEEQRILLVAEFKKYVIFCTHFSLTDTDRETSVAIINEQAGKHTKPIYLLGDLNAEPNSNPLAALKQKWTLLSGEEPTFPADKPVRCIDYILASNRKKIKFISTKVLDEPITSDHRPVIVEVDR